jgi:hypothetical protein
MSTELPPGQSSSVANQPYVIRPAPAQVELVGQNILLILTPISRHLLGQARQRAEAGEHQFAVVLSQAACDLHTEEALGNLLRRNCTPVLADAVRSLLGTSIALDDNRVRRIYGALTGDYPAGHKQLEKPRAEWWDAWHESRQLRHEVAHAGKLVTPEQATASIESSERYVTHVTAQVDAALRTP